MLTPSGTEIKQRNIVYGYFKVNCSQEVIGYLKRYVLLLNKVTLNTK